jgi:hypothetical protein
LDTKRDLPNRVPGKEEAEPGIVEELGGRREE